MTKVQWWSMALGMGLTALFPAGIVAATTASGATTAFVGTTPTTNIPYPTAGSTASLVGMMNVGRKAEGLGALVLPSNWTALTNIEQALVLVDLERTARGGTPFAGLTAALDADAQTAADDGSEDGVPNVTVWAGGVAFPLGAVFVWMYDDGYDSPNEACTTPTAPGCWGHRHDLMVAYPAASGVPVMGAGFATQSPAGAGSSAIAQEAELNPTLVFSWASEVAYLPACEQSDSASTCAFPKTPPLPAPVVSMAAVPDGSGYWLANATGQVSAHGGATNYGEATKPLDAPIVHIVATADGGGYWLVAADGGIFAFGDAPFYGSMGGKPLAAPVVDIAPTETGGGYWLVAADGGIFGFGNARFYGSMGGKGLNAPVIGITAGTAGYRLVASDGGIFSFGNAQFYGSMAGQHLNKQIVGMARSPTGDGYWLVAQDGGIFAFGTAGFHGSTGSMTLVRPIVGMATDQATGGYWLVAADGGIFSFDAPFDGAD